MEQQGNVRNQFLGTFCILLNTLSNGAMGGWTSPSIPILMSNETPLADSGQMTMEQISWMVSLISPGSMLGIIIFGWMMDQHGRKLAGCCLTIPQIISWMLIFIGSNEIYLYVARFLAGVVGGGMFTVIPIYINEISETRIRGLLGSLLVLFVNAGVFFGLVAGAYLDYRLVPIVFLPLSFCALVCFSFFPETPEFLSKNQRYLSAEKSLRFYRGLSIKNCPDTVLLTDLKKCTEGESEDEKLTLSDFASKSVRKAITISIGLSTLNQLCGCVAMTQYTATIFEIAGSSLSPNASAIVVGLIQVLGTYCSTVLVEKAGRKILMVSSAFGISFGLFSLAVYSYLEEIGVSVAAFKVVPFVSFCLVVFSANVGVLCLPFVIMSEMLAPKVKTVVTSFCLLFLNVLAFITIKFLPWMMLNMGLHGMVLTFSVASFFGGCFVIVMLPETKGKNQIEIMSLLNK